MRAVLPASPGSVLQRRPALALHGAAALGASAVATVLQVPAAVLLALALLACVLASRHPLAALMVSVALGALLATVSVDRYLAARWPQSLDGARLLLEARIDSLPSARGGEWVADAQVVVTAPATLAGRKLRLRLSGPLGSVTPRVAERWQFVAAAASPRAHLNPGGVDLERQWLLERVHGRARVLESPLNRRLAAAPGGLQPLRQALRERTFERVAEPDAAALLVALSVGDTAGMSREQWRVFAATGITHLVAISGLHVTLFSWLVAAGVRPLWRYLWLPEALRNWRRETVALSLGFIAALGYSLLAGFTIPTQRTLAMLAIVLLARLAGRVISRWDVLGAAAVLVLLIDPLAVLDIGFWLSFGALAALMWPLPQRPAQSQLQSGAVPHSLHAVAWLERAVQLLREQGWIGFALLPLTLLLFDFVSIAGWVVNLVAIPLFSFVLVPLALVGVLLPPLAEPVATTSLSAAAALHGVIWQCLRWVADLPGATLAVTAPDSWWVLAAALLAAWLLPVPLRLRLLGALLILPLVAAAGTAPAHGAATLTVLDVTDAGAVVLRTQHHVWLLGTGAAPTGGAGAIDRHLLPWLRAQRIHRLDAVVIHRPTRAEVSGVAQLLASVPVGRVWTGADWRGAPLPTRPCPGHAEHELDGVRVELFTAALEVSAANYAPGACAVRVQAGEHSVLWIGAATATDLAAWAARPAQVRAGLLIGGLRARRDAGAWAEAVLPQRIVSTAGRDGAARVALGGSYRLGADRVHLTAVDGPINIELAPSDPVRMRTVLDRRWTPRWRVPRDAAPML
jgi:competence protein ComEC